MSETAQDMKDFMACKSDINKFDAHVGGICGGAMWSVKLDGVRCCAVVQGDGTVQYVSRSGKAFPNFATFDSAVLALAEAASKRWRLPYPIVFDGEVVSKDKRFNEVMTQVRRLNDVDSSIFEFHIFDIWIEHFGFYDRYAVLTEMLSHNPFENVFLVEHNYFSTKKSVNDVLDFAKIMVERGHEGLVLKSKTGLYEHKRSIEWCKVVFQKSADLEVIGVEPGNGKHAGKWGHSFAGLASTKSRSARGFPTNSARPSWPIPRNSLRSCTGIDPGGQLALSSLPAGAGRQDRSHKPR
jgi:ATP-dependent DNA ligase